MYPHLNLLHSSSPLLCLKRGINCTHM
jgi:hypothetical protein